MISLLQASLSFRGDAKLRTRNLEIPGLVLSHHPGMTTEGHVADAPRNDGLGSGVFNALA
jgi:hypothetical protein